MFKIVIPRTAYAPCSMKILNDKEKAELFSIFKHLKERKPGDKIISELSINDPQLVWLGGAVVGDIVETITYSPEAGKFVQYSTVIP